MHRRMFLTTALAATVAPAALMAQSFEVTRTRAQWQAMLSDIEFHVMREEGTEAAGTSPLDANYAPGTYHCRGCDLPVYPSSTKYDSGTGWPSFYASFQNAIGTKADRKLLSVRTEVHCRRCGSHFGHIFSDGPAPTGQRHCLNGVSLVFRAA
ncbi:peptide-methionine (R)-S-oxide reductase MsrB [Loktanella sp. SALINAS62]|uniref:peptide-methionine (R)-S-oxide reductase MsrB n=1 Tax=Loktanella sp. SALINAS62 TaxID=2706124 RepID=UPI001B8DA7CE|nr:peptide-methionine (R)-S-oxide reductase MsrB [Loktanella sp. SALINAS62]MBS1303797.1 peptide-methionine (R)-S-oxide reductase MsrB [Loktanella sp. SALINAS62]